MNWKNILILVIVALMASGCVTLRKIAPAKVPSEVKAYLGKEIDKKEWQSIDMLEDLKGESIVKHISTQLDCKALMEKDKALYAAAIQQVDFNLQEAKSDWNTAVGSVSNPGWLLSLLIGVGGAMSGKILTQLTHYSEAEVEEIKKNANKTV